MSDKHCQYIFEISEPNYIEFEFDLGDKKLNFINKEWLTTKINTELSTRQGRLKIERKNKEKCAIIKAEIETLKDILHLINNVE